MNVSLKWSLVGGLLALAVSGGVFLSIPGSNQLEEKKIKAEESDYSRSLYGVPVLEMNHYKIGEDKHLNYMLKGNYSVGRDNPSGETLWLKSVKDNPELLTVLDDLKGKIGVAKDSSSSLKDTLGDTAEAAKKEKEEAEKLKAEEEARLAEEAKNREEDLDSKDDSKDNSKDDDEEDSEVVSEDDVVVKDLDVLKSEGLSVLKQLATDYSNEFDEAELKDFNSEGKVLVNSFVSSINFSKSNLEDGDLEKLNNITKELESLLNNYAKKKGKDSESISSKIENSLNGLGK